MKFGIKTWAFLGLILLTSSPISAQDSGKRTRVVTAERIIPVSAERVWQAMVLDYGEISNFAPSIYTSGYENGSLMGKVGAERKCSFNENGSQWVHERILELDSENRIMRNRVIDAEKYPLDMEATYAYYKVRDNDDGTATAIYELHYRAKPAIMNGLMKRAFQKQLTETLIGLEHYLTTGEVVNATTGNWDEIRKQCY
ncbi:MAG TPA: hypothetical protein DCE41_31375 [Cytophagales bacterium]|nr:hypothetical protein [Cytophagales bacterium]HAA23014.1 hypothetical protein [Cytophagales bacterium]HAP63306.1 hypothetical protein [Cytophagales bacterium]